MTGHTLFVTGTAGNDVIAAAVRGTRLRVVVNNVLQQFTASSVNRIEIQAGDGADKVDVSAIAINTYVFGGTGNDLIKGGSGNDTLTGAAGKDTIYGNGGDDRLNGNGSPDVIYGGDGNDVIYGGDGGDVINGDAGNDHIWGDAGSDTLYGGAGNDVFYTADGEHDFINGGAGKNSAQTDVSGDRYSLIRTVTTLQVTTPTPPVTVPTGPTTDPTNPPVSSGDHPLAISINDESLWDTNFTSAVQQLKNLGVKAVRLYVSINSYSDRPSASAPVSYTDFVTSWNNSSAAHPLVAGLAMKRAFALKRAGFKVLMTFNVVGGAPPSSAQQVSDFYTYMMNATETPGSSAKLKDSVDYWEIGNEVDQPTYWQPSAVNKGDGLREYVDDLLIPAANALHSGPTSNWEQVVSSSVSYNAGDLQTILNELRAKGRTDAIDEIGYHPYGQFDPSRNIDEISGRTSQAVGYAKAFGRPLIATEWNIRGFSPDGSQDAAWAADVQTVYNTIIKPNYLLGFYYTLVNNYAARGGSTTARPAGLLTHNYSGNISTTSSVEDLLAYYESPLVAAPTFYAAFDALS